VRDRTKVHHHDERAAGWAIDHRCWALSTAVVARLRVEERARISDVQSLYALVSLVVMRAPFGFMAFLGIASLVGVIVSHVIVLFDFIEEMHAQGAPLRQALLDAGIVRLRPVLITVGATVFGLIPLALHGGPLWEGLCYTQIGGLSVATVITLLLVPVLYAIFVLDLKIVRDRAPEHDCCT